MNRLYSPFLVNALATLFMVFAIWMVFLWVPTETNQGAVQRILYIHVPIAWGAMISICIVAVASILYLHNRSAKWDRIAVSSAEVGAIFGSMMLFSGMMWARPVWGVFWTGEAKLITTLILFLLFVAYLTFRNYFPEGIQQKKIAAVIGIIGAIDTPIIYFAANLWERAHPPLVTGPASDQDSLLSGSIELTLLVSAVAFSLLLFSLINMRYSVHKSEDAVNLFYRNSSIERKTL